MSTIRLTLNPSLEEVIQELEQAYKPMSRTEILKMIIAEFYNGRFKTSHLREKSSNRNYQKNVKTIDKWLENKTEPDLVKGEIEEIFGDWWSENKSNLRS